MTDQSKAGRKRTLVVVILVIVLFLVITIPSFIKARNTSSQNACINNLRMIHEGAQEIRQDATGDLMGTDYGMLNLGVISREGQIKIIFVTNSSEFISTRPVNTTILPMPELVDDAREGIGHMILVDDRSWEARQ